MITAIKNIVNIVFKNSEYLLIGIEIRGEKKNKIAEIFVDSRNKLGLNDLTNLNRLIWEKIEEKGLNENFSKITVSSPGIDRSFKYIEQLPKHTGREIEIILNDCTRISGTLDNVMEEEKLILVKTKGKKKNSSGSEIMVIDFKNIKESKIKLKF
ncbi:MAG: hypothetical protein JW917_00485 [Ignavibacteria bacterium]|nr:hypothetical protein [Ignavibacteria bacterium]